MPSADDIAAARAQLAQTLDLVNQGADLVDSVAATTIAAQDGLAAAVDRISTAFTATLGDLDSVSGQLAAIAAAAAAAQADLAEDGDPPPPPVEPTTTMTATPLTSGTEQRIRCDWATTRTDVTGWLVGRDGVDTGGGGPWQTPNVLAADTRAWTFNVLKPGTPYTLTLRPQLATGTCAPVTATATTLGGTPVDPPVDPGGGDTAAARLGWGAPLPCSDSFAYSGTPDPARWELPGAGGWDGHVGNGRRMPENVSVGNGMMTLRGDANGNTGWVRHRWPVRYGRWEFRLRSRNTGTSGGLYHVLFLVWPTSESWPGDGEYDAVEYTNPDGPGVGGFLHYPHPNLPVQQEYWFKSDVDVKGFHNYAFEWAPTGLTGWIDGVQVFHYAGGASGSRRNIQDMPSGSGGFQLDNFTGDGGLRPAVMEIDWVNFYPVAV